MNLNELLSQTELKKYGRYYSALEPYLASPRTRSYLSLIFTLSTLTIFGWFAIRPTIVTIISLTKELGTLRAVNAQMTKKIEALSQAQDFLQTQKSQLLMLDYAVPTKPDVNTVIKEIEGIGSQSQVSISSIQFQRVDYPDKEEGFSDQITQTPITISFSAVGNQNNLISFLDNLVSSRRIFTIGNVDISGSKGAGLASSAKSLQLSVVAPYFAVKPSAVQAKPEVKTGPTENLLEQPGNKSKEQP